MSGERARRHDGGDHLNRQQSLLATSKSKQLEDALVHALVKVLVHDDAHAPTWPIAAFAGAARAHHPRPGRGVAHGDTVVEGEPELDERVVHVRSLEAILDQLLHRLVVQQHRFVQSHCRVANERRGFDGGAHADDACAADGHLLLCVVVARDDRRHFATSHVPKAKGGKVDAQGVTEPVVVVIVDAQLDADDRLALLAVDAVDVMNVVAVHQSIVDWTRSFAESEQPSHHWPYARDLVGVENDASQEGAVVERVD